MSFLYQKVKDGSWDDEKIEILQFNYDGRGSALAIIDGEPLTISLGDLDEWILNPEYYRLTNVEKRNVLKDLKEVIKRINFKDPVIIHPNYLTKEKAPFYIPDSIKGYVEQIIPSNGKSFAQEEIYNILGGEVRSYYFEKECITIFYNRYNENEDGYFQPNQVASFYLQKHFPNHWLDGKVMIVPDWNNFSYNEY